MISTLIGIVVGAILGFFFSYVLEWLKKRSLIQGYITILHSELKNLKEDNPGGLDDVIKGYNYVNGLVEKNINTSLLSKEQNPSEFLKRWCFRHKYAFLRNNLDKLSLFQPDTVKSLLKIYSYMEDYEEFRTGTTQLPLINNLQYAQNEIPITLSLLAKESLGGEAFCA
jgi:hypothetical protein